jgi:hypothetical protein
MCSQLPCCHTFSSCTRSVGCKICLRIKGNKNASRLGHFFTVGWAVVSIVDTEVHPAFCCEFHQQSCILCDFTIDSIALKQLRSQSISVRCRHRRTSDFLSKVFAVSHIRSVYVRIKRHFRSCHVSNISNVRKSTKIYKR